MREGRARGRSAEAACVPLASAPRVAVAHGCARLDASLAQAAPDGSTHFPLAPARVIDTRNGTGGHKGG
jgi:hypothetical protein